MKKPNKRIIKKRKKASRQALAAARNSERPSWDELENSLHELRNSAVVDFSLSLDVLEKSLRGLRNLNAIQVQIIGHVERIGRELLRNRL